MRGSVLKWDAPDGKMVLVNTWGPTFMFPKAVKVIPTNLSVQHQSHGTDALLF